MVLCNVTKVWKSYGLYIDFSLCNITASEAVILTPNATIHKPDIDDSEGAMKFTVAVILVYGLAVMGAIGLRFITRKKRQNHSLDKEAVEFVKNYGEVMKSIDTQNRVGAVSSLLRTIHNASLKSCNDPAERKNWFGNFEMFALAMSPINEERKDENNNVRSASEDIVRAAEDDIVQKGMIETNADVGGLNGSILEENHIDVHNVTVLSDDSQSIRCIETQV